MLKYRKIAEYELNGTVYATIEALNENNKRVWVKSFPKQTFSEPVIVANILDRPKYVGWRIKQSHIEEVNQDFEKRYMPAQNAGSICLSSGTFVFSKESSATVSLFPFDPLHHTNPVGKFEVSGNSNTGSTFIVSVDAPTWVGYATTSGTITQI